MKRPKKLTYNMKKALSKAGYDPKTCRLLEEDKVAWRFLIEQDGRKEAIWVEK